VRTGTVAKKKKTNCEEQKHKTKHGGNLAANCCDPRARKIKPNTGDLGTRRKNRWEVGHYLSLKEVGRQGSGCGNRPTWGDTIG